MFLIFLLLFLFKVILNERHQVQGSRVFVLIGNVCPASTSTLLDARSATYEVPSGLHTVWGGPNCPGGGALLPRLLPHDAAQGVPLLPRKGALMPQHLIAP